MITPPSASDGSPIPSGSDEVPDWALTYSQAALRCGQKIDAIEKALVAKGLSTSQAENAVNRGIDSRFAMERRAHERYARLRWLNRGASIVVAFMIVAITFTKTDTAIAVRMGVFQLFPLTCIWFAEAFGRYVGPSYGYGFGYINRPTPAVFVMIGGWLVLAGVPLLILAFAR
ncbi:MAG TPA: hypothetical protein VHR66_14650 [Gemmataceae bacterium]|jgi:hypothetical protein|nr:hypothetical protein [Gemmataceae bacterium]